MLGKTDVSSLYNPEGIMWANVEQLMQHAKREEIDREMDAQIGRVLDTGLRPSHLDYHNDFAYRAIYSIRLWSCHGNIVFPCALGRQEDIRFR